MNTFRAKSGIFQDNKVNTISVDAIGSASDQQQRNMLYEILTLFHEGGIHMPVLSHC